MLVLKGWLSKSLVQIMTYLHEVKGILPRIKVVGMTQIYKENEIVDFVEHSVNYNYTGTELNPECKLIKLWPTKKILKFTKP
jgi:hypothetical protein